MASVWCCILLPLVSYAMESSTPTTIQSVESTISPTTSSTLPTTTAFPFNCENLADGNYQHPTMNCSHMFFTCANGISFEEDCAGGTYFDQLTNKCLYKKNVVACGGTPENITATEPTITTTLHPPVPDIMFDCMEEIGNFPNPMVKCSPLFFICAPGYQHGFPFHCAAKTFYDWEMNKCLYHDMIPDCSGKNRTEVPEYKSDFCVDKSGNYPPDNLPCPDHFFQCSNQRLTRIYCQTGLIYDASQHACLIHTDVAGCADMGSTVMDEVRHNMTTVSTVMMHNTTDVLIMNATEAVMAVNSTVSEQHNMTVADVMNVTEAIMVANSTLSEHDNTTESLMPNDFVPVEMHNETEANLTTVIGGIPQPVATESPNVSQSSNHSAADNTTVAVGPGLEGETVNTTGATGSPATTGDHVDSNVTDHTGNDTHQSGDILEISTLSPTTGGGELKNSSVPRFGVCKDRINGFYPNPDNCNTYFFCADLAEYQIQCQGGTVFNERRNQCDSPYRTYGSCGKRDLPKEFSCDKKADGRYADPLDCNHYYSCSEAKVVQHKCEGGLSFNNLIMQCDLPQNIPGCAPRSAADLSAFCTSKGKDDIYAIANPNNYVLCVQGTAFVGICPPVRSIFDVRLKSCVSANS